MATHRESNQYTTIIIDTFRDRLEEANQGSVSSFRMPWMTHLSLSVEPTCGGRVWYLQDLQVEAFSAQDNDLQASTTLAGRTQGHPLSAEPSNFGSTL
jgi:hypothetical protein